MDVASEVTSSYVGEKDDELELGLGLSIGGGLKSKGGGSGWVGQYARILTAKDFGTSTNNNNNCCSSSSNSGGTKRSATDSVSPPSYVQRKPMKTLF
ncbi:hypothetical protein Tco_1422364 [Tanacetum coccineum]